MLSLMTKRPPDDDLMNLFVLQFDVHLPKNHEFYVEYLFWYNRPAADVTRTYDCLWALIHDWFRRKKDINTARRHGTTTRQASQGPTKAHRKVKARAKTKMEILRYASLGETQASIPRRRTARACMHTPRAPKALGSQLARKGKVTANDLVRPHHGLAKAVQAAATALQHNEARQ
jgi:hypothetical protein